ncbi:hypothetical protein [Aneurinibacillus tyrosinisolvens]|uniref:hypothetical protein n=1 Tax=Aneurinibacillus tyrosinisolvens TaxID=1443435 RepID=UPI00063EDB46|nr:hypothetical protein [Aneurinibacillus tyrosinisolvens]
MSDETEPITFVQGPVNYLHEHELREEEKGFGGVIEIYSALIQEGKYIPIKMHIFEKGAQKNKLYIRIANALDFMFVAVGEFEMRVIEFMRGFEKFGEDESIYDSIKNDLDYHDFIQKGFVETNKEPLLEYFDYKLSPKIKVVLE